MKNVFIAVSDSNYINHVKSLFGAAKNVGKWGGDLALVGNNLKDKDIKYFEDRNVTVLSLKNVDCFKAKNYIFSSWFKQWDRCIYMDVDIVIRKPINSIFESKGQFLADKEPFFVHQYWDKDEPYFTDLKRVTNVNEYGFNSSCMIFDTELIKENDETIKFLENLDLRFSPINNHTGLPQGTDQPILNIYFQNVWTQIPNVCYFQHINNDTVAMHMCRWNAQWNNNSLKSYYDYHLNYFNNVKEN